MRFCGCYQTLSSLFHSRERLWMSRAEDRPAAANDFLASMTVMGVAADGGEHVFVVGVEKPVQQPTGDWACPISDARSPGAGPHLRRR